MIRLLWAATIVLAALGVFAAGMRAVYVGDYASRMEERRQEVLAALGRPDPPGLDRAAIDREVDRRFVERRLLTLLHVVPGGLYLLLAPLQLSKRVRSNVTFHRWNGRFLIVAGLLSVLPGFFFGVVMPFAGPPEAGAVAIAGSLFAFALCRAYVAIRAKQVSVHREWMLRAFAIGIGISVVRLAAGALDLWLTPLGWATTSVFALSLWVGWGLSLGVTEFWIRHTRAAAA